jgi:RNA polymerase sigma-70 factor (ECF subfamily)
MNARVSPRSAPAGAGSTVRPAMGPARAFFGGGGMNLVQFEARGRDDPATWIVAVAAERSRADFIRLFERFAPRVKGYLIRLGAPAELAEELAQETLLSVWRKAAYFDPARAGASTWIFTIARNLRIDAIRRDRHPEDLDDPGLAPEEACAADVMIEAAERDERLRAAMTALPQDQAEVIRLSFFLDKPHSEISRELGLPLGTVKSRLRLAMVKLRTLMDDLP